MRAEEEQFDIVVIDDEAALCEATESLLTAAGFRARSFPSAEDFLRSESRHRAACLIVDVRLPGMTGLQLQQHLLANGKQIPTIFVTAQEDSEGRKRAQAMRAGALAFLHKPFDEHDLLDAVQAAFDGRARARSLS